MYVCHIFKAMKKSERIEQHALIRYADINDWHLHELQGYSFNISKDLYALQCRLSLDGLGLLFKPGKGLPGHGIIIAVSPMLHLINLPRCHLIEISGEINELYQQIYLKRRSSTKKETVVSQKEQTLILFSLGNHSQRLLWFLAYKIEGLDRSSHYSSWIFWPKDLDFFIHHIYFQDLKTPMNSLEFSENLFVFTKIFLQKSHAIFLSDIFFVMCWFPHIENFIQSVLWCNLFGFL